MDAELRLTTGKAAATITDVDYQQGLTMGASEQGSPFSCDRWENNQDLSGARLVGAVTFLNVPFVPFTHDTILTFRFVAEDSVQCIPSAGTCSKPCSSDASCSDGDPCNGVEFCHLGQCHPGVPISCDDGNECNGSEACDSANGGMCDKSPLQQCNDDNPCTVGVQPDLCASTRTSPMASRATTATSARARTRSPRASVRTPVRHARTASARARSRTRRQRTEDDNACNGIMACVHDGDELRQIVPPLVCAPDGPEQADLNGDGLPDTPGPVACDDLNACTGPDICADRQCHGDPSAAAIACVASGTVCMPATCAPTTGACVTTTLNCDDLNVCTDDTCDPTQDLPGCLHTRPTRRPAATTTPAPTRTPASLASALARCRRRQPAARQSTVCFTQHCDGERGLCPDTAQLRRRRRHRRHRDLRPRGRLPSRTIDRL
jgi:hypothetical protein